MKTPVRRAALFAQSVATLSAKDASLMKSAFCATKTKPRKLNRKPSSRRRRRRSNRPTIRFTPYAWAKLLYLRDAGDTEIGGFAVTSPNDLLLVEDVCLVRQQCTAITVEFDDESVADFYDEQVDAGLKPEQFGRIWLHTHPGTSSEPSLTDEETFDRCFGNVDWAVMFILAKGGETYARLRFNVGPQSSQDMNVEVDYTRSFEASNAADWQREFAANVRKVTRRNRFSPLPEVAEPADDYPFFHELDEADEHRRGEFNAALDQSGALDQHGDEDWFDRLYSEPLFLDWEDDECETLLSTIPG
jgi:proteasome lid subunit RPN8/RPN11